MPESPTKMPSKTSARRQTDTPFFLGLGLIGGLYVLLILGMLVADASFTSPHHLWQALQSREIRYAIQLSLVSCSLTAILSVWVAVPIGYLMSRHRFPGKAILDALLDIPIVLPPLVVGLSLLILFQTPVGKAIEKLITVTYEIPSVIMGKTGSGKTTLLEAICGLKPVATGCIRLMGEDVTDLKPAARGVSYVPQDGALFPSMSVRDHLAFALTIRRWPGADIEQRVRELAAMLGLEPLLARTPPGLSGGEAQRVALGRALASRPHVLCLDEPLSALDEETHAEMCDALRTVRERTGVTILHVTHSLTEARKLADRVFLLVHRGQSSLLTLTASFPVSSLRRALLGAGSTRVSRPPFAIARRSTPAS